MARARHPQLILALLHAAACAEGGGVGRAPASGGLSVGVWTGPTTAAASATEGSSSSGSGGADAGSSGEASTQGAAETGADAETGGEPGRTASGDPTEGEPKFDLGDDLPTPKPEPADPGCGKIDLLFVIDNSASMREEQMSLVASFPGFVQEIQGQLADAESLHIGVVTTDAYEFNEGACAGVLGGLVTRTGGEDASGAVCGPYASGGRFMSEADDLAARFACAAQVGTEGDGDERPIDAALYALGPGLAAPGACNEGFSRADALLVLVLITDEEEEASVGDPPLWFNTLVALKGGAETNVVVLALIGPEDPMCPDAYEVGHRLVEFTDMFSYGHIGQICAPSYQSFFHEAIAGIVEACDGFTPPA